MKKVVVTGTGIVCSIGENVKTFWINLIEGKSGIKKIDGFSTEGYRNQMGGIVPKSFDAKWQRFMPGHSRSLIFAFVAAKEAVGSASGCEPEGLIVGTGAGNIELLEQNIKHKEIITTNPYYQSIGELAKALEIKGFTHCFSQVCVSSSISIGYAAQLIRIGEAKCIVCGGYEALSPICYSSLSVSRAVTTEVIRPFSINRSGTLQGEGGAFLVLEEESHAINRGAKILAYVDGFALNTNAHHMSNSHKDAIAKVIVEGLDDAKLDKSKVDYINAHGTATISGDAAEAGAIIDVFGENAKNIPVSSIKGAVGHAIGAAGAIEAVATVMALKHQILPPTLNFTEADPQFQLDFVPNKSRVSNIRHAISLSAGLGGNNSILVFSKGVSDG